MSKRIFFKRTERPYVGGVSNRSRNGALSRKGCGGRLQSDCGHSLNGYTPAPPPPLPVALLLRSRVSTDEPVD